MIFEWISLSNYSSFLVGNRVISLFDNDWIGDCAFGVGVLVLYVNLHWIILPP